MKATLLVADAAQSTSDGKVHALGIGWTLSPTPTPPMAVLLLIDLRPEDDPGDGQLMCHLELINQDASPVVVPTPQGDQPIEVSFAIDVSRPPGYPANTAVRVARSVAIPPLPLEPGRRYRWRATIGDQTVVPWTTEFGIMAMGNPATDPPVHLGPPPG